MSYRRNSNVYWIKMKYYPLFSSFCNPFFKSSVYKLIKVNKNLKLRIYTFHHQLTRLFQQYNTIIIIVLIIKFQHLTPVYLDSFIIFVTHWLQTTEKRDMSNMVFFCCLVITVSYTVVHRKLLFIQSRCIYEQLVISESF